MAIEILKREQAVTDSGLFNLPPSFDKQKLAAHWAEESNVDTMRLRQPVVGAGATADGWEVWKSEGSKGAPVKVKTGNGRTYVLMCRSRHVQDQVNALYGNLSKRFINKEVRGETAAGEAVQDPGILTEERLRQQGGGSLSEESILPLNQVSDEPSAAIKT
jgi:hypothetical protein